MKFSLFKKINRNEDPIDLSVVPEASEPITDCREVQEAFNNGLSSNLQVLLVGGGVLCAGLLAYLIDELTCDYVFDSPPHPDNPYSPEYNPEYGPSGYNGRDFRAAVMGTTNYSKHGKEGAFGADRSWNRKKGTTGWAARHQGVDISAPVGTPVYAPFSGVISATNDSTSGTGGRSVSMVSTNGKYKMFVCHLSGISVKSGQQVEAGQQIAKSGASGKGKENCYGAHVHVQVGYTDTSVGPTGKGWVDPDTFSPSDLSFSSIAGPPRNQLQVDPAKIDPKMKTTGNLSLQEQNMRISAAKVNTSQLDAWLAKSKRKDHVDPTKLPAKNRNPLNVASTGKDPGGGTFGAFRGEGNSKVKSFRGFSSWRMGYAGAAYLVLVYLSGKMSGVPARPSMWQIRKKWCSEKDANATASDLAKMANPNWTAHTSIKVTFENVVRVTMVQAVQECGAWNPTDCVDGCKIAWSTWIANGNLTDEDTVEVVNRTVRTTSTSNNKQPKVNTNNRQ